MTQVMSRLKKRIPIQKPRHRSHQRQKILRGRRSHRLTEQTQSYHQRYSMDYAEDTARCNTNNEDENTNDQEHSDPVQNEETTYEEVHVYLSQGPYLWRGFRVSIRFFLPGILPESFAATRALTNG